MKKYSKKTVIISAVILISLISLIASFVIASVRGHFVISGVLESEEIAVPALISGPVSEVYVKEGDPVDTKSKILEIDSTEAYAQYQTALSAYSTAKANYEMLVKGAKPEDIKELNAKLAQAQQKVKLLSSGARKEEVNQLNLKIQAEKDALTASKAEYQSAEKLFGSDIITKEKFDAAKQNFYNAKASLASLNEQLKLLKSGAREEQVQIARQDVTAINASLQKLRSGASPEEMEIAKSDVDKAQANLKLAEEAKNNALVTSTMQGIVADLLVKPGELVTSGSQVATIINPDDMWVRGYIPESKLLYIHPGKKVVVAPKVDKKLKFTGTISKIATKATFIPEGGKDSVDQQVFEVKISVNRRSQNNATLQPGMSVYVNIDI